MRAKHLVIVLFFLLCIALFAANPGFVVANNNCVGLKTYVETLRDEALDQPVTNVFTTWHDPAGSLPGYCEVTGRIFPETDFAVRLPAIWNGRSIHFGGGGWDGYVGAVDATSLQLGYASSTSNGGHVGRPPVPVLDGSFGLKDPYYDTFIGGTNPYSCQKIVDFGNRALREAPLLAKQIINWYYGMDALYSYYSGGSTGGREGLVSAQKDYDLYDGLYIMFPTGGHIPVCSRGLWNSIQGAELLPIFSTKAIALHNAVYGKCDSVDGLIDGVIEDPRKCNFDHLTDLPACPGDVDAEGCFTLAHRTALKEIFTGPHNSTGQLYIGTPLSAEWLRDPADPASTGFGAALYDVLMPDLFKYIVFDPPPGPDWDMMSFDWETDPDIVKASTCQQCYDPPGCTNTVIYTLTDELDAVTYSPNVAPNMGGFAPLKDKGGKIVQWHGWSDALVSPLTSSILYDTVLADDAETPSFWKLYMAPGVGHGDPAIGWPPTWTEGFGALVEWVEKGVEPVAIIGTRAENAAWGWPVRTRPICPYPEVARYKGAGSIDEAANFTCATVVPATVDIKQTKVKVGKGSFKAMMTIPEGYTFGNKKDISAAVSEGASAKRIALNKKKGIISANFNMKDAIGITAGDAVIFTVTALFDEGGKTYALEGSDTVEVLEK